MAGSRKTVWMAGGALVLAAGALALTTYAALRDEREADAWPIGRLADYPADTPIEVVIDHAYFQRLPAEAPMATAEGPRSLPEARLWVVNRGGVNPVVFSQLSPWLGCRVVVATRLEVEEFGYTPGGDFELLFIDPCHGGVFSLDGEHLAGPGSAGLSRFTLRIAGDERLLVDLTDLRAG